CAASWYRVNVPLGDMGRFERSWCRQSRKAGNAECRSKGESETDRRESAFPCSCKLTIRGEQGGFAGVRNRRAELSYGDSGVPEAPVRLKCRALFRRAAAQDGDLQRISPILQCLAPQEHQVANRGTRDDVVSYLRHRRDQFPYSARTGGCETLGPGGG